MCEVNVYSNCKYVALFIVWHCEWYVYDVTLKVSCMRCKMLFDNTMLNIIYTGCLKIYTLSDSMCLVQL